jgi:ribose 1,5-bisphosphokinase
VSTGTLILVVGPSGAGKDTLIDAARRARPDAFFPTRIITRPAAAGGEVFEGVEPAEFERRDAAGGFAFRWEAHGLSYGIPAEIGAALAAGRDVIVNASRSIIAEARARHRKLRIVVVTAPVALLAARLAHRGREDAADIAERLSRAGWAIPEGPDVVTVVNDGTRAEGVRRFLAAITPSGAIAG